MGRKIREKGSNPERKDYSMLLRELQSKQVKKDEKRRKLH